MLIVYVCYLLLIRVENILVFSRFPVLTLRIHNPILLFHFFTPLGSATFIPLPILGLDSTWTNTWLGITLNIFLTAHSSLPITQEFWLRLTSLIGPGRAHFLTLFRFFHFGGRLRAQRVKEPGPLSGISRVGLLRLKPKGHL